MTSQQPDKKSVKEQVLIKARLSMWEKWKDKPLTYEYFEELCEKIEEETEKLVRAECEEKIALREEQLVKLSDRSIEVGQVLEKEIEQARSDERKKCEEEIKRLKWELLTYRRPIGTSYVDVREEGRKEGRADATKKLIGRIDNNKMLQKIEWGASPDRILKQIVEALKKELET